MNRNFKIDSNFMAAWDRSHRHEVPRKPGDPYWKKTYYIDPYPESLINRLGGVKEAKVLAGIGETGTHTHKVTIRYFRTAHGIVPLSAYSDCGSQRWLQGGGRSAIRISESDDLAQVNCDKCRGIRVKGGKAPEPKSTRPKIDPESRPKKYKFEYLFDYASRPNGEPGPQNCRHDVDVKAMTLSDARERAVKRINSWMKYYLNEGGKVHDLVLSAVYYWNDAPLWRRSSGTPYGGK